MQDSGKAVLGLVGLTILGVWLFAVFAAGGRKHDVVTGSGQGVTAAQPTAPPAEAQEVSERTAVSEMSGYDAYIVSRTKESVRARIRDPESVVFSGVHVGRLQGSKVVCGYLNADNALGGKTGRQRFIGLGDTTFLEEEGDQSVNEVWRQAC